MECLQMDPILEAHYVADVRHGRQRAVLPRSRDDLHSSRSMPCSPRLLCAASRRHHQCFFHARSPQPALPSPRKSTRYVVTPVAGRFEAQGQQRHGPLLSSSWELAGPPLTVVTQCDMAASHPQRSNKRRDVLQTANVPPIVPLTELLTDSSSWTPEFPQSAVEGTRSDLALGSEFNRSRWFPAPFAFMAVCPPSPVDGTLVHASSLAGLATRGGAAKVWDHHVCCTQGTSDWQSGLRTNLCHLMTLIQTLDNGPPMPRPPSPPNWRDGWRWTCSSLALIPQ